LETEVKNRGNYSDFIVRTGRLDGKMIETVTSIYEGKISVSKRD